MSAEVPRTLWSRLRWIVFVLWGVAAVKLALEFREVEEPIVLEIGSMRWQASIGAYYVVVVLLLVAALRGTFQGLRYGKLLQAGLLLGALGWCVPNVVVYTTAQFQEWTHGRFRPPVDEAEKERLEAAGETVLPERSAPLAPTPLGKVGTGVGIGLLTGVAGTIWCLLWIHVLVVVPRLFRGGSPASARDERPS